MEINMTHQYYTYQIEDGGCGIVRAETVKEAEAKVRKAYNEHGELSETTEVWIGQPDWFEDNPDVFEIGE